jgi:hypothetical protein
MNRDIKKISWDSERVKIKFEVPRTDGVDEYEMSCVDAPAPTLTAALSNLRRHVADICELPFSYCEKMEIRGVSFSYGGDDRVMGAVITALKPLSTAVAPLVLNTPHLSSAPYNDTDEMTPLLSKHACGDLMILQAEVLAYIDGQRAQLDLLAEVASAHA